jgi:hypothetical protein
VSNIGTVIIAARLDNSAPYAYDATFSVLHDRELVGQLDGYDAENDPLVAELVRGPNHDTLCI